MGTVVSYDVSDKNPEMKAEMQSKGYHDRWDETQDGKKVTINLPESTLWHKDKPVTQGLKDMQEAAKKLKIRLERAVAVPDDPSEAIPGDTL